MSKLFELFKSYNLGTIAQAGINEIKRKLWHETIKESYAQEYEDLEIEKLLKNKRGEYLEIGAYHPTRLSNTYRLYRHGWRGTVVEPNPEIEPKFKSIRPRDKYVRAGAGSKDGKLIYYQFLIPALNTFSEVEAKKSVDQGHKLIGKQKIDVLAVNKLIDRNFDLLSIDTEGMDYEILNSWPWSCFKPQVICAETDKEDPRIEELLLKQGYSRKFQNKYNSIFVAER